MHTVISKNSRHLTVRVPAKWCLILEQTKMMCGILHGSKMNAKKIKLSFNKEIWLLHLKTLHITWVELVQARSSTCLTINPTLSFRFTIGKLRWDRSNLIYSVGRRVLPVFLWGGQLQYSYSVISVFCYLNNLNILIYSTVHIEFCFDLDLCPGILVYMFVYLMLLTQSIYYNKGQNSRFLLMY
jgi:hypothetical protein